MTHYATVKNELHALKQLHDWVKYARQKISAPLLTKAMLLLN